MFIMKARASKIRGVKADNIYLIQVTGPWLWICEFPTVAQARHCNHGFGWYCARRAVCAAVTYWLRFRASSRIH
jgi:hypothetical protein